MSDIKQDYFNAINAWCQKTNILQHNPLHSATRSIALYQGRGMSAGDASVGILQENLREDYETNYSRYRASLVHDVNHEMFDVDKNAATQAYFPALDRLYIVAQAIDKNDFRIAPSQAFERVMNEAYQQFNTRRLRLETNNLQETTEQQHFREETYTALLAMYSDPVHAKDYVRGIDPQNYSNNPQHLALVDALSDFVDISSQAGATIDTTRVQTLLEQCFSNATSQEVPVAAGFLERLSKKDGGAAQGAAR